MADPAWWGLEWSEGRLFLDGQALPALAERFGTPLYVASARVLRERSRHLLDALKVYSQNARVCFSYKTNPVAGVLRILHEAGLGAEVTSGYELWLAQRLGIDPGNVVMNGANKSDEELAAAVELGLGLIVVDGPGELERAERLAAERGVVARIALRICPDVVPRGLNASSVTGSRKNQFGMDLDSEALLSCLRRSIASPHLLLRGIHAHIGSGIHDFKAFQAAALKVLKVQAQAIRAGAEPDLIDLGGGLGTRFSREFTTGEMLLYLGTGRLPRFPCPAPEDLFERYAAAVAEAVERGCRSFGIPVPELVVEPGRALVSDAMLLLLSVGAVRERPTGRFALTDGGAMTASMMFLSEHHAVLLANREAPVDGRTSIFGRLPSPMDSVYRNLPMPRLQVGDLLAVMDAGAYFTSTATNFGGPRPPVILLDKEGVRLIRRRETFEDLARVELAL